MAFPRLYFVTMDNGPAGHLQQVAAACEAGIRWIQLRMKTASDAEVQETALAAKKICEPFNSILIINDRVAVAAAVKAHGVHVGKEDISVGQARQILGPGAIIGGTANTVEDIREHYRQGADYIGLGPYRYTTTKKKLSPFLGLEGYRSILSQLEKDGVRLPVVAIGGIGVLDIGGLLEAGLHGIAFSGLLVFADKRGELVRSLEDQIRRQDKHSSHVNNC